MVVSPDGSRVAYWSWERDPRRGNAPGPTVHVRDLDTGSDTSDIQSGEPGHGVLPEFSPDGDRIVFEGHTAVGSAEQLFSQPADGSGPAEPFGPAYSYEDRQGFDILPDGRSVAFTTRDGEITVIDIATGAATVLPVRMHATDTPSWQRVAP
jgi:Tol biopolymer transport system component